MILTWKDGQDILGILFLKGVYVFPFLHYA